MTDGPRLHARVAHSHLAAVARELPPAHGMTGGGACISDVLASQADPDALLHEATPPPPKRVPSEFPSAVPANIQKKSEKKNIPGVHRVCACCYYSFPAGSPDDLTCRANAPRPSSTTTLNMWPVVKPDDWCGDWADAKAYLSWDVEPEVVQGRPA